jgi:hypothetical protein
MHSELPGLAMNSHFGSVGSSAAALPTAPIVSVAIVIATSANTPLLFLMTNPLS